MSASIPPPRAETPNRQTSQPGPDEPPWRVWTAPAAVLLGLTAGVIATIVIGVLAQLGGSTLAHPTPAVSLTADLAFDLSFVFAAIYFASLHGRPRAADFGFRRPGLKKALGGFVLAGIGYYVITALYASALKLHGRDKLPSELGVSKSTAALVAATVFVCVIAPIAEEFFFRGFFFGALRRWRILIAGWDIGPWLAAIVTGILFGIAHTGSASSRYLIPLGFLGFVLCLLRWWTGSLYPCMALHSFNNSLALGINQLHWNGAEITALVAGSVLLIGVATMPLAGRQPRLT
jgi:membrane protease YdiL (CAAX protease family)